MKKETIEKCKKVVDWMLWRKVGINKACKEFNVSVGSVHNYIYEVLRFEDDETFRLVTHDMKERYKR